MKTLIIATLLVSGLGFANNASAATTPSPAVQQSRIPEVDQFLKRRKDPRHRQLIDDAGWALMHNYSDSTLAKAALESLATFQDALDKYEQGDASALAQLGGLKGIKNTVAGWLSDGDPEVRGFAAIWLGVSGDRAYARHLAKLMNDKTEPDAENLRRDRGRAALALGLMGANQYTPQLVDMLNASNEFDRGGAAYGLGYLKAKKYETTIGRLLYDKDESVRTAAEEALGLMD